MDSTASHPNPRVSPSSPLIRKESPTLDKGASSLSTYHSNKLVSPSDGFNSISPSMDPSSLSLIKLSFRSGGHQKFMETLRTCIVSRAWEIEVTPITNGLSNFQPILGVSGILRNVNQTFQVNSSNLSDAFIDLSTLMKKASQMVQLSELIQAKLSKEQISEESQEMMNYKSHLIHLGISSPVTR